MPALPEPTDADVARVLAAYPALERPRARPMSGGLINRTFAVEDPAGAFVLQRINPIFDPVMHHNIEAVTRRLRDRGLVTPTLLPTRAGALWFELPGGGAWRLMTRVPGRSFDVIESPAQARSAGALVARFHSALHGLEHSFRGLRVGVHDTAKHLEVLARALARHREHPLRAEVEALAHDIRGALATLPEHAGLPTRIAHGDLKFSNVLFAGERGPARVQAICLVDLDTLAPMPLHHELGDAWRSWCNVGGEDGRARFDLEIFAASLEGYVDALAVPLRDEERAALLHGVEWICLELAARFAADALNESYFGWDRQRYARAGDHNLARARGQRELAREVVATRRERAALLGVDADA